MLGFFQLFFFFLFGCFSLFVLFCFAVCFDVMALTVLYRPIFWTTGLFDVVKSGFKICYMGKRDFLLDKSVQ